MRNNKGYTLIELVAAIPLTILVFAIITISLIKFARTYQENRILKKAQNEVFQTIETFRYGYTKGTITKNNNIIGLLTASKVVISNLNTALTIYPVNFKTQQKYFSRFYRNGNEIWVKSQYGLDIISNTRIFPSEKVMVGREPEFKIVDLKFYNVSPNSGDNVRLVGIDFKINVRFREKAKNQSSYDDLAENTKTIEFHTKVYAENSDIQMTSSDNSKGGNE